MKRFTLLLVLITLVVSCAAPSGAVFASSELSDSATAAGEPETGAIETQPIEVVDEEPVAPVKEAAELVALIQQPGSVQPLQAEVPATETPAVPPVVVAPPTPLPSSPLLITAYKAAGAHMNALQLYNNSSDMVPLDGVSLLYVAGGDEYEVPMVSGWVKPRSYMVIAWQGESEYADVEFQFEYIGAGTLESIEMDHSGYQPLIVTVPARYGGDLLHRFKSTAGNYTTNTTFAPGAATISGGGLYALPGAPEVSVREILVNPRSCVYGAETPDCYDYIKVRNDSVDPLDLSRYRLRSGFSNTNSTASNTTYFSDSIAPGDTATLAYDRDGNRVSFTANDGTVWLEDVYGFETYDLKVPPYIDSDLTAQTGRSWAYNDETATWQWATPAPNKIDNDFTVRTAGKGSTESESTPKPCRDDQYRSEETGRCRNVTTASTLTPCKEGQYRSEETNRCRSIAATAASVLKPCADDQFRNPVTNRCKSIASSDDVALADCGEGRERNPETNRCRNILLSSPPEAAFAVDPTKESAAAFTGWWILGGIAAVGAGYGIWEWRYELAAGVRRTIRFTTHSK